MTRRSRTADLALDDSGAKSARVEEVFGQR
jgi:hypothetical protein